MAQFKIFDAGPVPPKSARRPRVSNYPFADMPVGFAFDVPEPDHKTQRRVSAHAGVFARHHPGTKFATRRIDTPDGKVVRVWRVA